MPTCADQYIIDEKHAHSAIGSGRIADIPKSEHKVLFIISVPQRPRPKTMVKAKILKRLWGWKSECIYSGLSQTGILVLPW